MIIKRIGSDTILTYKDAGCTVCIIKEGYPFSYDEHQHVSKYGKDEDQLRDELAEDVFPVTEEAIK